MSDSAEDILDSAVRIDYFGDDNTELAAEVPYLGDLFVETKAIIVRLENGGVMRISSQNEGKSRTQSKAAAANSMERKLRKIANTALTAKRRNPDFDNVFKVPRGGLTYTEIVEYTQSFLAKVPDAAADFDRYALKKQFFDGLQEDLDDFRGDSHLQADAKRTGVGITADVEDAIKEFLTVRKELDTTLQNLLADDHDKLAEWNSAKRIIRSKSSNNPPQTPTEG